MLSLAELHSQKKSSIDKVEAFRLQQQKLLEQGQHWFLLPLLLIVFGGGLLFLGMGAVGTLVIGFSVVIFLLIGAFKILPAYTRFNDQFKRRVLYALLEDLYPSVYYAPDNYVPSSLFAKAKLYPVGTSYTGKDYVEGETEQGDTFKLSALSVSTKLADSSELTPLFTGLFWVIDIPQQNNSAVYILPDTATLPQSKNQFVQQPLESFFSSEQSNDYRENCPAFGTGFIVYSQTTEAAQSILKTPLIEALYHWYSQWNCTPHFSIIGQQLFIALPLGTVFPAPDFMQKSINNTDLNRFYDQLLCGLSLVDFFGVEDTIKDNKTIPPFLSGEEE